MKRLPCTYLPLLVMLAVGSLALAGCSPEPAGDMQRNDFVTTGGNTQTAAHGDAGNEIRNTETVEDELGLADDIDNDGVINSIDNCPARANPQQEDNAPWPDGGRGDACSGDVDFDGVWPPHDNCPIDANPRQEDVDGDGRDLYCDANWIDHDNDGHGAHIDNCRLLSNPGQEDADGDASGNDCDGDNDNDGIADATDNCAYTPNANQADEDGDGFGDACEIDADNDERIGAADNCLVIYNPSQSDMDKDGVGDVCDTVTDSDSDDVADWDDNCPAVPNPIPYNMVTQRDYDGDEKGDACDTDNDDDAFENTVDNCPWIPNADQGDSDHDGIGDTCDTEGTLSCGSNGDLMALDLMPGNISGELVHACVNCRYAALYRLSDDDPDNNAFVVVPDAQSRENQSDYGHIRLTAQTPVISGRAAFMVALPNQPLRYGTNIGMKIEALRDGAPVASRPLPLHDAGDGVRKMVALETAQPFDALRLVVGGGWPRGEQVNVYAVCVERP
ncbi:MAG TPA: thrombospondin type 3 repeat-containing protein [Gammaproteobacteria bacterium]